MSQRPKQTILDRIPILCKIFIALLIFFFGGLIYVVFRTRTLNMFGWFSFLGLDSLISFLRMSFRQYDISDFVKYNLPDGLWLFSYLFIIKSIYGKELSKAAIISYLALPLIAVGSEISQIFKLIPGVFDIFDLICYICSILIFWLLNKLKI